MTDVRTTQTSDGADGPGASPDDVAKGRRKAAAASWSGTLIETYDFVIYGTAAALVFPETFFPALGPAAGTVASLATLGIAFVFRPLGGVLFGHFGDRHGRKKTLVASLLLMGVATALVGLLPTSAAIGVLAPIGLVVLRAAQGLAAGGEWAGAALLISEYAPTKRRGLWTIFPQLGGTCAIGLGNATFLAATLLMSDETFVSWGWRVPFLTSALLVVVGLWVRLSLDETPVFKAEVARAGTAVLPVRDAIASQRSTILLGGLFGITAFSLQYLSSTYLVSYATRTIDLGRPFVLTIGVISGVVLSVGVVIGALLSDRFGRRPTMAGCNAVGAVWAVAMFLILTVETRAAYAVAVLIAMFVAGVAFGPMAAVLSELFETRYRYSASGIAYNLTGVIGGGIVPVTAVPIGNTFGGPAVGVFMGALSLVALAATLALPETRETSLETSREPSDDAVGA